VAGTVTGMNRPISEVTERQLLEAVCRGDEDAFRRLVEPHRPGLRAHCDRMLGSVDGEDALQEALLRAWRGLSRFEGRSSLRNWLYRIATNASLDALGRGPERVIPIHDAPPPGGVNRQAGGGAAAGSMWVEPYPNETLGSEDAYAAPAACYEQREAVELAVVAVLRHLPPRQRAVLILREVLGFSADEAAQSLGTTVASVNSALQRARRALDARAPVYSQRARLRSLGDERVREMAASFIDAFERGDVDAIVSLLTEDATSALPSCAEWYRGPRRDRRLVARARSAAKSPRERAKAAR
jgi:RNA polymerase sigma-70 factor (ECF subfamily)